MQIRIKSTAVDNQRELICFLLLFRPLRNMNIMDFKWWKRIRGVVLPTAVFCGCQMNWDQSARIRAKEKCVKLLRKNMKYWIGYDKIIQKEVHFLMLLNAYCIQYTQYTYMCEWVCKLSHYNLQYMFILVTLWSAYIGQVCLA